MTQQDENQVLTEQQREEKTKAWNQAEYIKMQKFCATKGIQVKSIDQQKSQCLAPHMAVWYAVSTTKGEDFWVINGAFPTDIAPENVAKNARIALRHFSMRWQLKAANMEAALTAGKLKNSDLVTQQKIIKELTTKAEMLYAIMNDEVLWKENGLTL